jgi:tetratricopeptide (TPR) repeat protein
MRQRVLILTVVSILTSSWPLLAQGPVEVEVELANGLILGPGILRSTETISENAYEQGGAANSPAKPIGVLDDKLRNTIFNLNLLPKNSGGQRVMKPVDTIEFPFSKAEIETMGGQLAILGVLDVSKFNIFGRRTFSIRTPQGAKHLLQAITELSPLYCKVETLRDSDSVKWDQRIATDTIPSELLSEILHQNLDLSKSSEWTKLVRFYMQAERFAEAREEVEAASQKFPTDFDRVLLTQLDELNAAQLFREVKARQDAGQYQLAISVLNTFPMATLPVEVQLKVQDQFASLKQNLLLVSNIVESLKKDQQDLPPAEQELVAPLVKEIFSEVNLDSAVRLADYERLRADPSLSVQQRISLALSGWLLGSGAAVDNFATTKSLITARGLVQEYLIEADAVRRTQLTAQLKSLEGGQPDLVVKLLALLKPPKTPPPVASEDPPGLHRMQVLMGNEQVSYLVQTPPEYDPNRVYPCVVSLPSLSSNPEVQVSWWCGSPLQVKENEAAEAKTQRLGQATRNGYIVISPVWAAKGQLQYNYSEIEHLRVLKCYRDALRHFSIDTDRVFISGHQAGAAAAWDIALAHPDMWAGAVMISPTADKFIIHYDENAKLVPMYFVYGQFDGSGFREQIGKTINKYVSSMQYDAIAVSYIGREGGYFPEEAPRIMDWMQLSSHRRNRNPKEIKVSMMRPGDRFFYWIEAPEFVSDNNSFAFKPADANVGIEARLTAKNGISVNQIPAPASAWIWLTPELVDFKQPVSVRVKGNTKRVDVSSDLEVILEDARQRADRLHPFHFKIAMP